MVNMLIMGKPGAGKGTLASRLLDHYRLAHISTGNIYREEIAKGSAIGVEAQKYISQGELVPDDMTNAIVYDILKNHPMEHGFMLDGYPRTKAQAIALDEMLHALGLSLDVVVNMDIDDDLLMRRMAGRRVCPKCGATYNVSTKPPKVEGVCDVCGTALIQRADDSEESVKNRLRIYNKATRPLLGYYEKTGLLMTVDGALPTTAVFDRIVAGLDGKRHGHDQV
ncbi:MAG: adenylate kinase [Candidatus Izemoplasmatales bacterium]